MKVKRMTIAAANTLLRAVKWKVYRTEYRVMIAVPITGIRAGKTVTGITYRYAYYANWLGHHEVIRPQDCYRDALEWTEKAILAACPEGSRVIIARERIEVPR